ncbi:MAG: universal stress protein [Actinobacteria bacterium]|nr:universal stress protein [Actinomycetota bacterium]
MAILPRRQLEEPRRPALDRVLCAVDGSRGSGEAVREALAFAPCAARLCFVAVTTAAGDGPTTGVASLAAHRARQTLEQAQALAGAHALAAETELVRAADVTGTLVARAAASALLVVGSHGDARDGDAATGSVASALAGRASGPVLVARAGARADRTRPRIFVAVDDNAGAAAVVGLAGSIAAACAGYVHLVHVQGRGYGSHTRHRLAELSIALIEQTGAEPVVDVACGANVGAHICQLAQDSDSSLVVVGRRRDAVRRGLGPVAERIVDGGPCSVLVSPASAS